MYDADRLAGIHGNLRQVKQHMWEDHGERDMQPMIVLHFRERESRGVPPEDVTKALNMGWDITQLIEGVFMVMDKDLLEDLDAVWLGTDAYAVLKESDEPPFEGSMEHDFKTNPATEVQRIISTIIASDDLCGGCDIQAITQPYSLEDGGRIVWGEPFPEGKTTGAIADVFKKWFRKEKL